jgi:tripartite-type tricarboxylate transporter receptor subunit TctC
MTIVRKINADVTEIQKTPEMEKILAATGAEPLISSPDEFLKLLKSDVEKWAKVVKAAGVKIN